MRHGHKTWMAEDGIPEILAEHRLGHEVPGMRGLYAHASDQMREDLKAALQARWEDSLRERAALHPHSPVPLLDELLAPFRAPAPDATTPRDTQPDHPAPGGREKMISQIPPNQAENPSPGSRLGLKERASDLVRDQIPEVELRGFEPLTPSMRTLATTVDTGRCRWSAVEGRHIETEIVAVVAAPVAAPGQCEDHEPIPRPDVTAD